MIMCCEREGTRTSTWSNNRLVVPQVFNHQEIWFEAINGKYSVFFSHVLLLLFAIYESKLQFFMKKVNEVSSHFSIFHHPPDKTIRRQRFLSPKYKSVSHKAMMDLIVALGSVISIVHSSQQIVVDIRYNWH